MSRRYELSPRNGAGMTPDDSSSCVRKFGAPGAKRSSSWWPRSKSVNGVADAIPPAGSALTPVTLMP
jgi:hypothetical protein